MKSTYTHTRCYSIIHSSFIRCLAVLSLLTVFAVNTSNAQCGLGAATLISSAPTGSTDPSWATIQKNTIGSTPANTVTNSYNGGLVMPVASSGGVILPSGTARNADFGSPTWQAQWTNTALYILVTVPDLTLHFDPIPNDQYFYNYDAVEIYLSGNNNHAGAPYGPNDVQYGFSNGVYRGTGGGSGAGSSTTGVTQVVTPVAGGYTMFITIPLSSFTAPGTMGSKVSFDVAIDDNDQVANIATKMSADSATLVTTFGRTPLQGQTESQGFRSGGDYRDAQVAWHGVSGNALYNTPSQLGDLTLTAPPPPAMGSNQTLCSSGFINLVGTNPSPFSGVWTATGGSASLADLSSMTNPGNPSIDPTPSFTPLSGTGTYVFTWTISSPSCVALPFTQADDTVFVKSSVTPTFNPLPAICSGAPAPVLPTTSTNPLTPITGTWLPAPVSNTVTGTYFFSPTPGLCANFVTLVQVITVPSIVPTFTPLAAICSGSTPAPLPATSTNGITGTWNPSTIDNTIDGTYTFTPDAGQCGLTTTITQSVISKATPTFTILPAICTGATAPVLPTSSTNATPISGSWSPMPVSNTATGTYTFTPGAGECANTVTLVQTINPPTTIPTFNPLPAICKGFTAPILGSPSNNGITGTWNPAIVSNTASGTYTFTPTPGQCAFTTTITQVINNPITPTFAPLGSICTGAPAPTLPGSSTDAPPITGSWVPSTVSNTVTGTYTFTPTVGQCATTTNIVQIISPNTIVPTFNPLSAICTGATAPTLPGSSTNGTPITGSWIPATVNNTTTGTYTFTPNTGQCALTTNIVQVINPNTITPTFTPLPAICTGATAPTLPGSSTNGTPITGSWVPATVNNTTTGTYTFTPNIGQCALTTNIVQVINPNTIIPTFVPLAAICSGSTAPVLSGSSTNGISGVWSPIPVDNTIQGTYTFTPNTGQCALTTSIVQAITPSTILPTFTPVPAICIGGVAPTLPLTSNNGLTGTWSPATVSNTATGTYTFTPNTGMCATPATLVQTVNNLTIPAFTPLAALCTGAPAPVLPTSSLESITGTWAPMPVSNTTTSTYTFTPTAGQCATTTTIVQAVNNGTTMPTFTALPAVCNGGITPVLPTSSLESITGTWAPMPVSNTTTDTYTFTPATGQCALSTTLVQTITTPVVPSFTPLASICSGATATTLPASSLESITGTWLPATINNTAAGTYTFTPNTGQCATTTIITQAIMPTTIAPTFAPLSAICQNSIAPVLPTSSTNATPITGTWAPMPVSNTATGTYTFTPNGGQCALTTTTLTQTITIPTVPAFAPLSAICTGAPAPVLPTSSTDATPITGTWSPMPVSNTTTGTYTFTPTPGQCATTTTLVQTINVGSTTPTFTALAAICMGSAAPVLPTSSVESITGTWAPIPVSNTTTGTYTFTPDPGQCALTTTIIQTITTPTVPTFTALAAICTGATAPVITTTSTNATPINGTWSPVPVDNTATATYTFTPSTGQCATTTTLVQTINPATITPTFSALAAICQNSIAPVLPTSSTDATPITGTWLPIPVENTTTGTYTFTPDAGQCALPTTITQTVTIPTLPAFAALPAICQNGAAPVLSTISTNATPITGTWSPLPVDNTITGTYTFTPTAGQCALTTTITQTVTPNVTPTFTPLTTICSGTVAPVLSTSSLESITGTWLPSPVNNTATGTYTFTPDAGECALTTTTVQNITIPTVPTFTPLATICNSATPVTLPTTSIESITGNWNPATIDNTNSGTYTFTPTTGICATTAALTQTITPNVLPTFNPLASICNGASATTLPATSIESITGNWSPATIDNSVSGTYIFTPTAGLCALTTTITQTVTPNVTPTFTALATICSGTTAPVLPTTSLESITGSWNPATVDNQNTGQYTFTPTAGLCALSTTIGQSVNPTPLLLTQAPNAVCSPATVDITATYVTSHSPVLPAGTTFTYYTDAAGTTPLPAGMPANAISVSNTYYIVGTAAGCNSTPVGVSVIVNQTPLPPVTENVGLCQNVTATPLSAQASDPGNTLYWYTAPVGGNDSTTIAPVPPTRNGGKTLVYYVAQKSGDCISTRAELDVRITTMPIASLTASANEIYATNSVMLSGAVTPASENVTYDWIAGNVTNAPFETSGLSQPVTPPSSVEPPFLVTNYFFIATSVENPQCADTASIAIRVVQPLLIPNIFSPNGDGINEYWDIKNIQEFTDAEVSIFNRYGQFIYKSSDGYRTPWDGNYDGQPVPVGTYFYIIKTTANAAPISGSVAIVR